MISELDAALTMIMRALETRPSSITAANTKQTIRRAEPLFFCFISKRYLPVLHLQELPDGQQAAEHAHEEARDRVGGCDDLNDVRERSQDEQLERVELRDLRKDEIIQAPFEEEADCGGDNTNNKALDDKRRRIKALSRRPPS